MASAAQIAANQENATHSTGPRTQPGKNAARFNAFRHGLTSQTVVMPNEDAALYEEFIAQYHDQLDPRGIIEEQLVQTLADIQWRLNRARAHEAALLSMSEFQSGLDSPLPDGAQTALNEAQSRIDHRAALNSLSLHENRWQKLYLANLKQLQETQAARRAREAAEMPNAILVYKQHRLNDKPFLPEDFGFVLTELEIERHLWQVNSFRVAAEEVRGNPAAAKIKVGRETRC